MRHDCPAIHQITVEIKFLRVSITVFNIVYDNICLYEKTYYTDGKYGSLSLT